MQDNSDLIIRDCCEAEVAQFGKPDTICITVDVLREIVQRHFPGTCLHQIQEPAAAEQAAWHAGLDEGRAQAAPAAVAVRDAVRDAEKLLRAEAARLEHIYSGHGNKWYGFSNEKAAHIEHLRVADALAATPAAPAGVAEPAPITFMTEVRAREWAWDKVREEVGTQSWTAGDSFNFHGFYLWGWNYRGQYELQRTATRSAVMQEILSAAPAAAAPADGLATATGLPAQAVARIVHLRADRKRRIYVAGPMTGLPEFNFPAFNSAAHKLRAEGWHVENPAEHGHIEGADWADYLRWDISRIATCGAIYLLPGWEGSKGATLEVSIGKALGMEFILAPGAAPQAQADARDADGEAFRTAARLGLTLRFYGNCAQSGAPGTPSVYEVTTGPDSAEAMRASIDRAAIAAAKGE
ncbi:DUF4406 domain-containing protein [Comamonas testosteroni]|uniref:DUF4406 domain-containing protein n=1 Tax=Comamonas testosteroni TaxID=285 RepID=UPI000ADEAFFD|nr:DUF4406 domain-containing protein [Comamonas testosteroni]